MTSKILLFVSALRLLKVFNVRHAPRRNFIRAFGLDKIK